MSDKDKAAVALFIIVILLSFSLGGALQSCAAGRVSGQGCDPDVDCPVVTPPPDMMIVPQMWFPVVGTEPQAAPWGGNP